VLMLLIVPMILAIWLGRFDNFLAAPFRAIP